MARYLIRMRRGIEARLALAVLALLAGCGEPAPPEEIHADVRGVVTSLAPAGPGHGVTLGVVRIAGGKQPDTRYGKAVLTVTTATRIYERQAFGQRQVSFADLRLGDKVEVHFAAPPPGPTAPAQPVAATAGEILILLRLGPPAYAVTPPSAPAPAPPAAAASPGRPAAAGGAARRPGLTVIRDLQPVCDAEGVVTWVLGLAAHREPRVFTLANPPRLVVDVAH